jgi:hypothetical protein
MPASQKIITKLRERRQIEAELRNMLSASSEFEFRRQAQQIAARGSSVIPTLVSNLDRADGRMLAAMGTVASLLDRGEMTWALRQAILQPQRSDRGRAGALTILQRFLGQPADDDLLASLRDPAGMAVASLEEVLSQADHNPAVLIRYIEELDQQEPDVVLAVIGALRGMDATPASAGAGHRAVEPLRMMAQDVREEIGAEALQALGILRLPEAGRALQTLIPITAPPLRPLVERLLRKLRFSGVEVNPLQPPDPGWRALVSPLNGLGQQSVWFIQESRGSAHARFLNILLSDRVGAVEAVGHNQLPALMLPPRRSLGHLHDVALPDGSGAMLLLEAEFDLGRRLVAESLARNRETQIPVAGPLRLLSPWLWGCAGAESLPSRRLPELREGDEALLAVSDGLLEHPAFLTWTARSEATFQAAEEALHRPGWDLDVWVRRLTGELLGEPVVAQAFSRRLRTISEWLLLSGDDTRSRLALVAAQALTDELQQNQPLLEALVRRDLNRVLQSLQQNSEPVSGMEHFQEGV